MKAAVIFLGVFLGGAFAQQMEQPLASFAGTVHEINATNLRLARPDQDDLDISLTHHTRYFDGAKKIKRDQVKPGARVSVETKLDLYLKPEAVNVRVLGPETE